MTEKSSKHRLTYRDAGVDIDAGNALVERIKPFAARTRRPEVMAGLGGFGALFELPTGHYQRPVLVSGTDGVGTKLSLANRLNRHEHIGIDLVAMCVNDIVVQGAEPLFFLDYYATGKLDVDLAAIVVAGIAEGCEQAGCALIGGETAEMPGMYSGSEYDLAGFAVGIVEREQLLDGRKVKPGDKIIGLASSGPHSNGYSLIRKIIDKKQVNLDQYLKSYTLADHLLAPTRIYVKPVLELLKSGAVHALAHITGGGLTENIPRVLPKHTRAVIDPTSWPRPDIFAWLQTEGDIADDEMLRTFNCGIGMAVVTAAEHCEEIIERSYEHGIGAWEIGHIEVSDEAAPRVVYVHS